MLYAHFTLRFIVPGGPHPSQPIDPKAKTFQPRLANRSITDLKVRIKELNMTTRWHPSRYNPHQRWCLRWAWKTRLCINCGRARYRWKQLTLAVATRVGPGKGKGAWRVYSKPVKPKEYIDLPEEGNPPAIECQCLGVRGPRRCQAGPGQSKKN